MILDSLWGMTQTLLKHEIAEKDPWSVFISLPDIDVVIEKRIPVTGRSLI